jgi:hypothetical protein
LLRRRRLTAEKLEPRLALTAAGIMPTLLADPIASAATVEPAKVALADDAYENNDTVATAYDLGTLTSPKTIGSLVMADGADWYKFTIISAAKPGDFVSINFNNGQGDLQLAIYSSYGYVMGASEGTGNTEGVTLNLLQPGTYYAKVYGAGGAQNPSYSLTISPPAASTSLVDDGYENNDTAATAYDLGTLTAAKTINSLVMADSEDWYKFTITSAAKPTDFVSINFNNSQGDLQLAIYSSYGYLMGASQGTGNSEAVTLNLLQPGTYYAKVFGASGAQNPNYSITISPPAAPASAPVTVFPDVAYYGGTQDWALNSINAPEAWAQGYTGQGVIVAVVDTGVDFNHPELNSQIYVNPGEIAGNGIDDDHNGYVDDTSGWDFYSNDNYADDGNGHGTHVAGIIAAAANGFGVTGVAPGAKIMPVRVLGSDGSGSSNSVAAGIRYAVDNGADIINMSLGGSLSTVIQSAIQYAQQHNVLVVSAAGNDSGAMPTYPARLSASLSNLISVGAYNSSNVHASFSDLVGASGAVQVDAPGVAIYSTYLNGQYATLSGTSMATPEVSGLAALTLSANPSLTAAQLRNLIVAGANRAISGSDSVGGVNAAITVALAASGQTTASAASADPNAQLAAARTALANWFASLATELQSQATGQQGRSLGESLSLVSGASRGWRTSAIDQVMRAWG